MPRQLSTLALAAGCVFGSLGAGWSGSRALAQSPRATPSAQLFSLPAGPLAEALRSYATQSGDEVLYDSHLVEGRAAPAVAGRLTPSAALTQLLNGSGLVADRPRAGVIAIRATPPADVGAPEAATSPEITVTGSLIRGRSEGASPLVTLNRSDLDRSGRATVADALSALPQNFGGVATPQTQLLQTDGLANNTAASTGVNLRGVGVSSTLVLVNGRRLPGSGLAGDFADVSVVPTAAVDKVEVLLDGASALYGSDAVGGVVNIRLRQDYTGAETRVRLEGATDGGDFATVIGQTFGRSWTGGHLLLSYEHQSSDRLAASDRSFTASADLRPLGGGDHRLIYSYPGNILAADPTTGAFSVAAAIPSGQDGRGLTPVDLGVGAENLENWRALGDILPAQSRDSIYVDASQALGGGVTASLGLLHTRRAFSFNLPEALTVFDVTSANPDYVAPPGGSTDELVGYAFGRELGPIRNTGATSSTAADLGLDVRLPRDWRLTAGLSFAQNDEHTTSRNVVNSAFLNEALGTNPDDPATAFSTAKDGYFNPFGGDGRANDAGILRFVGSGVSTVRNLSALETADVKLDGVLLQLPGGPLAVAVGAQVRRERFKPTALGFTDADTPEVIDPTHYARTVGAAFVEFRVPVVGPANALPGVRALELSLAGRVERYSDVGVTGNPKLGLVWRPSRDLKLRASWGTSFRAPSLSEEFSEQQIVPSFLQRGPDQVLTLIQVGGDPGLKPETATTWSLGADLAPRKLRGLTLFFNGFGIDYTNRIGQPAYEDLSNALSNPDYAPFVSFVSPSSSPGDLAQVQALLARSTSGSATLFPATAYAAIVDARFVNASRLTVRGIDAALAYHLQIGPDRLGIAGDAAYLVSFRRQLTSVSTPVDLVGTTGQPADLRIRTVADWSHGPFEASLAWTHVDGSRTQSGGRVDAWDTADLELGWRAPLGSRRFAGVSATLTVRNLLDADPPFYDSPLGVGYDTANADALGRVVALQVAKSW